MTRRLLAFARQQPLKPERIDINRQVGGIVRLLRRTLGEDIEIGLDTASDLWPVTADAAQLEAAITNLATNARDAMPNGGRLLITTANRELDADYVAMNPDVTPGGYAAIEVTDTGSGMPPEVIERIFEPFYTTKALGRGTGLGLSMVFGFIKQSGGHISVYSEPGIGTTFRLYFPRADKPTETPEETRQAETRPRGSEAVLAVEDNAGLRRIVVRQLRQLGYRPLEADGPAAALAVLETEQVDLLFTDIVMPGGIDGIALAKQAIARWPGLRVLLTSGFPGTKIDARLGALEGTVTLLSKPYRTSDLARALRETLGG
jgi:CheY-like chemotaxis protein